MDRAKTTQQRQGHRNRLRTRMQQNAATLADYEILELFLACVIRRQDTKPLAKELLTRFNSIRGVLDAKPAELLNVDGFGPALAELWTLQREVMARYAESSLRQWEVLCSPQTVAAMARQRLAGLAHEEIWVAYLDTQNRLLSWERASRGSLETAPLYPRDVLERSLSLKAMSIIMVHNHPGGNSKPSGADLDLTHRLKAGAMTLGIRVLDHVIVTDGDCYSLMQEGLLELPRVAP